MTLATPEDLIEGLGRDLTPSELSRVQSLLEDVSAAVQLRTGQKFVRAEYQVRARVRRRRVRLAQRPVHEVRSVTDRFGNAVAFSWDGLDVVHVDTLPFIGLAPVQVVDITYEAGPDEVPAAIVGVVRSIALRALGVDPTEASITQESIDGYAYTIGSAGGAGAFGVLPDEARILNAYSRVGGTILAGP